jgi:putative tricarboxylic transport membrane protein
MRFSIRMLGAAAALGLVAATGALAPQSANAFTPEDVECIAPADPGGGWDFTCRSVGKLLHEEGLVADPVQVTNMPGGVGAVAFANVAGKRADDPNLIVATSTVGITQIAQGKYPSGVDTMRWLGMLGTDVAVVLVRSDSKYDSLADLMAAYKEDPGAAVAAGSSGIGGWDHIRLLMIAKEAGMSGEAIKNIRWVQFDGGGPAVTQMLGGHVDVVTTDLGEVAGFIKSGDVKVLGVMSEERLPEPFTEIPTAREQGYDAVGYNWRGFYTGSEVSDAAYQGWADTLHTLFKTDAWKKTARQHGLVPIWRGGKDFESFVRESAEKMETISREIGVIQ